MSNVDQRLSAIEEALHGLRATADAVSAANAMETLDALVRDVALAVGLPPSDICSRRRDKRRAFARHVVMFLAREMTDLTLADIGGRLGGRDHTTVLYGVRKMEARMRADPSVRELVTSLWAGVESRG